MNRTTVHKKMPVVSRGGRLRYNKPCERCGQMMHNVGNARKYCDDCVVLVRRDNAERFRRCHRPGKSGPGKDVRTCVREADALGMSYGQYVAAGLDQVADAIGRDADEQTARNLVGVRQGHHPALP